VEPVSKKNKIIAEIKKIMPILLYWLAIGAILLHP
jgi:hypothetical protein